MMAEQNKFSEPTMEEITDLQIPEDVQISLSGERVVYGLAALGQKGEHKVGSIWIADVGKKHSARQLTSGLFHDRSPQWSPDGESIAFLSDRSKAGESCAIYVMSVSSGEAYPVTQTEKKRGIESFRWSPNGKFIAFISADEKSAEREAKDKERDDVQVYDVEVEYNRLRLLNISTREVLTLYENEKHVANLAWSEDSKSLVYTLHQRPGMDSPFAHGVTVETVSLISKVKTALFDFPGRIYSPLVWKDSTIFFKAGACPDKCSTSCMVYKADVQDGETAWSKYAHGENDCAMELQPTKGGVAVLIQAGLVDKIAMVDGQTLHSGEYTISTWNVATTEAGKHVLAFGRSTVASPPEIYSKAFDTEDIVQLSNHSQSLASRNLGTYHALHCPTFDGETTLDGFYLRPSSSTSSSPDPTKPLPTLVNIHGGPYYRLTDSFDTSGFGWQPLLLSSGHYGILVPNYRGNASRGDAFTSPARGHAGTVEYDDILALVEEGIKQGFIDKDKIVVGGWSQGGLLSYLAAVRNGREELPDGKPKTWRFRGAICGAGVTDWDMMSMTSDATTFEAECAGTAPWKAKKDELGTRKGSAIWEMSTAKSIPPVLILHGERDERVPVTQGYAFHKGCLHYKVPCELAIYPREPHFVGERAHQVDMGKRVKRFCDTHLG